MIDLGIKHHFSSGVYAKQMHLPKGHYAVTHKHNYDHLSILARGSAEIRVGDDIKEYDAPACIDIKANQDHYILALSDSVWFCIHATNETDPAKVDKVLIKGE